MMALLDILSLQEGSIGEALQESIMAATLQEAITVAALLKKCTFAHLFHYPSMILKHNSRPYHAFYHVLIKKLFLSYHIVQNANFH